MAISNKSVINIKPNLQTLIVTKPNNQTLLDKTTIYFDSFTIPAGQLIPLAGFTYPNVQSGIGPRH